MEKLINKKNALRLLLPAFAGNVLLLAVRLADGGSYILEAAVAFLTAVYYSALKNIPDEDAKKFQCVPAFLMFYLTAARIICCLHELSNIAGIIVLIPVAAGAVYSLIGTVKLWRDFFKNTKGGLNR